MLDELFKRAMNMAERQNNYNITKDTVIQMAENLGFEVIETVEAQQQQTPIE